VHCFIQFQRSLDTIRGVFVRPFNGCCFAIVGADVAHNFAIEIFDRTEDAAGDEASLDFYAAPV
jgi:hypothetical protein